MTTVLVIVSLLLMGVPFWVLAVGGGLALWFDIIDPYKA